MDARSHITGFLRSSVGNLGISSLILVGLEKLIDFDFVCPCQPVYNELKCACYAIVPFIACFAFTLRFMDPKPEDRGMQGKSTCSKVLYSLLIACIWLFLFFIDGQYVSCACSRWGGQYTETGALRWCKHNGNEPVAIENQQETQRCITISQFVGSLIALVISIFLISYCCCRDHGQQNEDVPMMARDSERAAGETVQTY